LWKQSKITGRTQKEIVMKTMITAIPAVFGLVTPAFAANSGIVSGTSILIILFLGFAALIIVFQFIPGLVLFFSMLKGLFKAAPKKEPLSGGKE
jgi:hypothetical protein